MPLPAGRVVPTSRGRRFVADVMHFCRGVPVVAVERRIAVPEVAAARRAADPRPGWPAVFVKGFGLAARDVPDFRRSRLTCPWVRLYEHAGTVAAVTVERELDGEPAVFALPLRSPETTPVADLDAKVRRAKTAPLADVPAFRRVLALGRLPRPARRFVWWLGLRACGRWRERFWGTVAVGSTASAGGDIVLAPTPLTSYFTFGRVDPAGGVTVRLFFDHRVADAAPAGRLLAGVERALNTAVLAELRALAPAARGPKFLARERPDGGRPADAAGGGLASAADPAE